MMTPVMEFPAGRVQYGAISGIVFLLTLAIQPALADEHNKTVFVTTKKFAGNFGGLMQADAICQAEAEDASSIVPRGRYLAWLSDAVDSPDTRFAKAEVPYILADGTTIAMDYADLTDGSLLHQIDMYPTGTSVGVQYTWTGTKSDGTSAGEFLTCDDWKADPIADFHGTGGRTERTDSLWSNRIGRVGCGRQHRFWCFQQ